MDVSKLPNSWICSACTGDEDMEQSPRQIWAWFCCRVQGWGLLSQFPPFRHFPIFSSLSKHTLDIEYHVCIWQVSPQLSCGDTCQIWKWFKESNRHFCQVENLAYGEINERSFSNPHPCLAHVLLFVTLYLWFRHAFAQLKEYSIITHLSSFEQNVSNSNT